MAGGTEAQPSPPGSRVDWDAPFSDFVFSLSDANLGALSGHEATWVVDGVDGVDLWAPTKSGNTQTIFFSVADGFPDAIGIEAWFGGRRGRGGGRAHPGPR